MAPGGAIPAPIEPLRGSSPRKNHQAGGLPPSATWEELGIVGAPPAGDLPRPRACLQLISHSSTQSLLVRIPLCWPHLASQLLSGQDTGAPTVPAGHQGPHSVDPTVYSVDGWGLLGALNPAAAGYGTEFPCSCSWLRPGARGFSAPCSPGGELRVENPLEPCWSLRLVRKPAVQRGGSGCSRLERGLLKDCVCLHVWFCLLPSLSFWEEKGKQADLCGSLFPQSGNAAAGRFALNNT